MTNPFDEGAPATDNSGVTASIKNHAGYDASMIVFKAGSAAGLAAMLDDTDSVGKVIDLVAQADKMFHEKSGGSLPAKPATGNTGRPASATQHPTGKKMYCEHDGVQVERLYKTGVTRSGKNIGKPWAGFDCPRNDPDHPRIWDN